MKQTTAFEQGLGLRWDQLELHPSGVAGNADAAQTMRPSIALEEVAALCQLQKPSIDQLSPHEGQFSEHLGRPYGVVDSSISPTYRGEETCDQEIYNQGAPMDPVRRQTPLHRARPRIQHPRDATRDHISAGLHGRLENKKRQPKMKPRNLKTASADQQDDFVPNFEHDLPHVINNAKGFACPFWRKDPTHNMDCLNLKLSRPRDVKQHLVRRHFQSTVCPGGSVDFSCDPALQEHPQPDICMNSYTDLDIDQLVPSEKQERLRKPANKNLSPADQWFDIWDLLFPDESRPSTPYLHSILGEGIGVIEDFWKHHGDEISAKFLQTSSAGDLSIGGLRRVVAEVLRLMKSHPGDDTSAKARESPQSSIETTGIGGECSSFFSNDLISHENGISASPELLGSTTFSQMSDPASDFPSWEFLERPQELEEGQYQTRQAGTFDCQDLHARDLQFVPMSGSMFEFESLERVANVQPIAKMSDFEILPMANAFDLNHSESMVDLETPHMSNTFNLGHSANMAGLGGLNNTFAIDCSDEILYAFPQEVRRNPTESIENKNEWKR